MHSGGSICRHGVPVTSCDRYIHRVEGFQVNPYSLPTRRSDAAPRVRTPVENREVMRDERGIPVLERRADGRYVPVTRKRWWESSKVREDYRAARQGHAN